MGSAETGDHRGGPSPHQTTQRQLRHFPAPPNPLPPGLVGSASTQDSGTLTWVPPRAVLFSEGRCSSRRPFLLWGSRGPSRGPPPPTGQRAPPSTLPLSSAHTSSHRDSPSGEQLLDWALQPSVSCLPGPAYPLPPLLPQEPLLPPAPTSELTEPCFSQPRGPQLEQCWLTEELPLSPCLYPPSANLQGSPDQVVCGKWGMCSTLAPS